MKKIEKNIEDIKIDGTIDDITKMIIIANKEQELKNMTELVNANERLMSF